MRQPKGNVMRRTRSSRLQNSRQVRIIEEKPGLARRAAAPSDSERQLVLAQGPVGRITAAELEENTGDLLTRYRGCWPGWSAEGPPRCAARRECEDRARGRRAGTTGGRRDRARRGDAVSLRRRVKGRVGGVVGDLGGRVILLLAASVAASAAFTALASELVERELDQFDAAAHAWLAARETPAVHATFAAITWTGSLVVLLPVCFAAAWYLWARCRRRIVAPVLLAPIVAASLSAGLKGYFGRARPTGAVNIPSSASFPSGHTTAATAVYLTLAYVLVRERVAPRAALALAVVAAVLVGASRIYLGVHWTTDVVGGWTVGAAVAAMCAALYERARRLEPAQEDVPPAP